MLGFLKFVRGYLCIRVYGFSPERFLNLCGNKGILLWDIHKDGDSYLMCISLRGFYQLKSIAKKTRTKVVVLKRNGLPFLLPLVKKRSVFVMGFVLAILFWYLSGMFVWDIEIEGNLSISTDQMNQFLIGQNVQEGMLKKELDIENMEKEIRRQFSMVTWTSAKLDGTKLIISIKENDAPIMNEIDLECLEDIGYDLVAPFSGKIVAMVVRNGVPNVKIGDEVEKGQVLVDGKIPILDENGLVKCYHSTTADADILIEHVVDYAESQKTEYTRKEYTGRIKKQSFLKFHSKTWKNPVEKPFLFYDCVMNWRRPILLEKINLPVYFGCVEYREYQNTEHLYTKEDIKLLLNEKFLGFLQTLEQKGVQIIEKDVKIEKDGEVWTLHSSMIVQEKCDKLVETQGVEISE